MLPERVLETLGVHKQELKNCSSILISTVFLSINIFALINACTRYKFLYYNKTEDKKKEETLNESYNSLDKKNKILHSVHC